MTYKSSEQVFQALLSGKMQYESALQSLSRYRRLDRLEGALLYLVGIEMFRHHCRQLGIRYDGKEGDSEV